MHSVANSLETARDLGMLISGHRTVMGQGIELTTFYAFLNIPESPIFIEIINFH